MIKKVSNILMVMLLLLATSGITMSKHYCGNNLRSVGIFSVPQSCCDAPGCCHTETEVYQVKNDFSVIAFNFEFEDEYPQEIQVIYLAVSFPLTSRSVDNLYYDMHSPPGPEHIQASLQTFIL